MARVPKKPAAKKVVREAAAKKGPRKAVAKRSVKRGVRNPVATLTKTHAAATKKVATAAALRSCSNLAYPVNACIHYIWGASSRRNKVLRRSALQPRPRYQVTI